MQLNKLNENQFEVPTSAFIADLKEEGDDLVLVFPDGFMDAMGWSVGDTLKWEVDGEVATITRVEKPKGTWFQRLLSKIFLIG